MVRLGSKHGRSKLTEKQVEEIRYKYSKNATLDDLADEYNVSNTNIWLIISGRIWGHVGGKTYTKQYARLTDNIKKQIIEMKSKDYTYNEISKQLGVSKSSIYKVLRAI
jgi:predicted DNA-binding protein YlxM (UPF0122 family)